MKGGKNEHRQIVLAEMLSQSIKSNNSKLMGAMDRNRAVIIFDNSEKILTPNVRGDYPRVTVPALSEVSVEIFFGNADKNERILIQAEDGGLIKEVSHDNMLTLDKYKRLKFRYQLLSHEGLYRVALYRGSERRLLQFWIGSEPQLIIRDL